MSWAIIKLEFQPERHDPNDVMQFLRDHFKTEDGVPTATVQFVGFGPHESYGSRMEEMADSIWRKAMIGPNLVPDLSNGGMRPNKIQAIKDLRQMASCGLKEAKDAMDAAERRNPYK